MTSLAPIANDAVGLKTAKPDNLKLEAVSPHSDDGTQFRAALERHMQGGMGAGTETVAKNNNSLGDRIVERTTNLASEFKKDQQYVSKMLEQATRTGDSMHLMKAMLALNDYQMKVQVATKVTSKAVGALDQLTKLQ